MLDLALAESLPNADGIAATVFAGAVPSFSNCNSPQEARAAAKRKGALLYCRGYEIDDGALLEVARNGGAVVFAFCGVIGESGFRRAILVSKMRLLLSACRRAGAGFVFCSLASGRNGLRSKRELSAFASVLGATPEERKASVKLLEGIIGRQKMKGESHA